MAEPGGRGGEETGQRTGAAGDTADSDRRDEIRKRGTPASPGIAIGRAYLVDRRRLKTPKRRLTPEEVEEEIARFHRALTTSDRQLDRVKQKIAQREAGEQYSIIEAHQLILHDEHLVSETIRYIREDQMNAEWALRKTVEHIKGVFDSIEDDYFRERRSDVDFVGERVMRNLLGHEDTPVKPPPDAIVVAHDLSPADMLLLSRAAVAGIITDGGGRTSHTAIIARAHELPAVVGLDDVTSVVGTDDLVVVDGTRGLVILNPSPQTVAHYRGRARREAAIGQALLSNRDLPAETLDGTSVSLMANIDFAEEIKGAIDHGAEGVGLFRTEFLFMMTDKLPTEEDHYRNACLVVEALRGRIATFRTFDLGADKLSALLPDRAIEHNPALGLRSLRLCLADEVLPLFKQQLRALLRASAHGNLRIMFPMVSGVSELRRAREVLDEASHELRAAGIPHDPKVKIGVMIEMPSAVMVADLIAPEVDFFSIGTNDLIQYTLAVDRGNEHVAYLYEPLHPALIRMIRHVASAAQRHQIPVAVCGEMAGDRHAVPVLLGLGLDELSMNAVAIPEVKSAVRSLDMKQLRALGDHIMTLATADEIRQAVEEFLADRFLTDEPSSA